MTELKADVLVLGAGMVGVSAALHLQQRGNRNLGRHDPLFVPRIRLAQRQNFSTHGRSSISHAQALRG